MMTKLDQAGLDMWSAADQRACADELVRQRCENSALLMRLQAVEKYNEILRAAVTSVINHDLNYYATCWKALKEKK